MQQLVDRRSTQQADNAASGRVADARYAYYRRCQVFRKNGEQCKAPAEKGSEICHAHASQRAMELRRKMELMAVLTMVVRKMRQRGRREFEIADIFMDFDAIQITLATMAQALIDGRIDCKTAGRLALGLQSAAKLLRLYHRAHRGTQRKKTLTTKVTKEHESRPEFPIAGEYDNGNCRQMNNYGIVEIVLMRAGVGFDRSHAPPERAQAA